jgi:hypothetical protein
MTIFRCGHPLAWGGLDLPLLGITRDWHGTVLDPPAGFALADDGRRLWFVAHHRQPAELHPQALPGGFQAGLWEYDCAELFIADAASGRYMEFNLAPNGAWWSCEFTAPRVRAEAVEIEMPEVATFAELAADGAWMAAMAIPLDLLRARTGYGPASRANVAFLLGGRERRHASAADLGGGMPDYHRPGCFPAVKFLPVPKLDASRDGGFPPDRGDVI